MKRLFAITIAMAFAATGPESDGGIFRRAAPPSQPMPPPANPAGERPLVWVVDGAGDIKGCSRALSQTNVMTGNPVELEVFPWSHGYRRVMLDQVDAKYSRMQGTRLAEKILKRSKQEPGRRVVLVAHSAGCSVALAAGDALPPDSIDRMILLAPSVSSCYDLRASLAAAHEGIDVFCSKKDWIALGVGTRLVGTVDKRWAPAAGRHGFQLAATQPDRLRQFFWTSDVAWTGHNGGHAGAYSPGFVHVYLFPLIGVAR